MLSALLIGFNVEVPEGQAGRRHLPADPALHPRRPDRLRHHLRVVPGGKPAADGALFGRAARAGNDRRLHQSGRARRRQPRRSTAIGLAGAPARRPTDRLVVDRAAAGAVPAHRGLVSASAGNDGKAGYLAITVNADPNDARTDRIPGDVSSGRQLSPGWGLHLADMSLAHGRPYPRCRSAARRLPPALSATPARRSRRGRRRRDRSRSSRKPSRSETVPRRRSAR